MKEDSFDTGSLPDALGPILESFLARLRRGERPSINEYTERYPEHAEEIREVFPPLAEMELAGLAGEASLHASAGPGGAKPETYRTSAPALEHLGDYRIIRELGGGGMGIVYEAEREALRSRVALKVIHLRLRDRPDHIRSFVREARAAAGLHHTNIVTVFDYGQHDGVCYYAMQYIDGHSLDKVLNDVKRLKREAEDPREGNGKAVAGRTQEAPLEPTALEPSLPDRELRSVSIGLVTGVFRSMPQVSTGRLVAALAGADGPTQDVSASGSGDTPISESLDSPVEPGNQEQDSVSSFHFGSTPGSSWFGKSVLRYQREIARIGAQVADALDHAHKRKVIHRDIKPHNILLDGLGNAWITDFGLAILKEEENQSTAQAFAGTLRYMAPERLEGKSDGRDDTYALGATLYEFLALRPVFNASDPHQLLGQIEHDPPTPLRQTDRRIHPDLAAIIEKCLEKDPAARFVSAAELRDELRRFIEGRPVKMRPVPAYSKLWRWCKREPWLAGANIFAAVTTTALAIGSTIGMEYYRNSSQKLATAVEEKGKSELNARTNLFQAYMERARAGRFSRRVGQRFDSLDAIGKAEKLGRQLGYRPERFDRLRDEAIACMALPDIEPTGRVITRPWGIHTAFDDAMSRYALRFRDGTILVRRYADDQEIARFHAQGDREVPLLTFSPDGRFLATTNESGQRLTVWNIDQHAVVLNDPGRVSWGHAARFGPDSHSLVAAHYPLGDLVRYDLKTGQSLWRAQGPGEAQALAFSWDGTRVAVLYSQKSPACHIVDAATGRLIRSFPLPGIVNWVAWSLDGTTLATCGDRKIYLWDTATGLRKAELEGHSNAGLKTGFHPDGTILASTGWEGRVWFWDSVLGRPWFKTEGDVYPGFAFSGNGRLMIELENKLTTYHVNPAREYRTLRHASIQPAEHQTVSIHPDGRLLAMGSNQGMVLWDLDCGIELAYLPTGFSAYLCFDSAGNLLTSTPAGVWRWPVRLEPADNELRIGPPCKLPLPAGQEQLAADREGKVVALAAYNTCYVATPERSFQVGPLDDVRKVALSPDGQWLATGSHGKNGAQVWRTQTGEKVAHLAVDGLVGVQFSPNGQWLMTTSSPCLLWEAGTWSNARVIGGRGLCFSASGR
jgi:serine/threonine protein kinase/WD40 repeat protein